MVLQKVDALWVFPIRFGPEESSVRGGYHSVIGVYPLRSETNRLILCSLELRPSSKQGLLENLRGAATSYLLVSCSRSFGWSRTWTDVEGPSSGRFWGRGLTTLLSNAGLGRAAEPVQGGAATLAQQRCLARCISATPHLYRLRAGKTAVRASQTGPAGVSQWGAPILRNGLRPVVGHGRQPVASRILFQPVPVLRQVHRPPALDTLTHTHGRDRRIPLMLILPRAL